MNSLEDNISDEFPREATASLQNGGIFSIINESTVFDSTTTIAPVASPPTQYVRGGLSREHINPITDRNWKQVLRWITFQSEECGTFLDDEGHSALHYLCLFRAPLEILEALLQTHPNLASVANNEDELPLDWAVRLTLSTAVLKLLLKASPAAGLMGKETALDLLWNRHSVLLKTICLVQGEGESGESTCHKDARNKIQSLPCWSRMMLLVNSYSSEFDSDIHSILASPVPPSMLKLALNVFADDLDLQDDQGRLPLHCAMTLRHEDPNVTRMHLETVTRACNPRCFQASDHKGNLPLHTALWAQMRWSEGLELVLNACPSTITATQAETGLPPCLLAASAHNDLDTVFELMKRYPEAVTSSV